MSSGVARTPDSVLFERTCAGDESGYRTSALGTFLEDVRRSDPSRCVHRSPYYIHKADKSRQWRLRKSSGPGVEDQPSASFDGQTWRLRLLAIVKAGGLSLHPSLWLECHELRS